MRCLECGAEFDEMNESQPVCPGCGSVPRSRRDGSDVCGILDDAAVMVAAAQSDSSGGEDADLNADKFLEPINLPADMQEAVDDAQALLEATGYAIFVLPGGTRFFRPSTQRLM